MKGTALLATAGAVLAAAAQNPAGAQGFPVKPVRVIVAQAAGSTTDTAARILGQSMGAAMGQAIVVDTRPGAGGLLGTEVAAKAPADGYTMLFANISTHGVNPALYRKLPYHPVKDFSPVSMATTTANVLTVHPSLPVRTTAEFVAFAKARPGQLNVATPGRGSSQHLATELFKSMAGGLDTVHVAYKGGPAAITALMTGETAWMIPTLPLAMPHIKSGKVRALAVTAPARLPEYPDLPALAETLEGYSVLSWYGFVVPAGTPRAAIARLNESAGKALQADDVKKSLRAVGMSTEHSSPEQFGAFIQSELAKWAKVAREANISLD